jgi:hypothetical protein
MEKQQTAVEFLIQELFNNGYFPYGVPEDIVEIADKMFENQIKDAYHKSGYLNTKLPYKDFLLEIDEYYNQTFKSE